MAIPSWRQPGRHLETAGETPGDTRETPETAPEAPGAFPRAHKHWLLVSTGQFYEFDDAFTTTATTTTTATATAGDPLPETAGETPGDTRETPETAPEAPGAFSEGSIFLYYGA